MKRIFLLYLIILFFITGCGQEKYMENDNKSSKKFDSIRKPAVAGAFYPATQGEIKKKIFEYFNNVKASELSSNIRAIIVPHAGYAYSGQVAASAYKMLEGKRIDTVVLLCNSHSAYFDGIAIDNNDAWETPLGLIEVDLEMAGKIEKASDIFNFNKEVHEGDHTLEVQLPFLQTVLGNDFKIVPILFGNTSNESYKKLAQALKNNMGENDLLVVSTDLSHYPEYSDANEVDNKTLEFIKEGSIEKLDKHITDTINSNIPNEQTLCCGIGGVKTAMELFNNSSWEKIDTLNYANSGDVTIGDKSRVVGYGALVFIGGKDREKAEIKNIENKLNREQQEVLLDIAKKSIEAKVRGEDLPVFSVEDERLNAREGAFVTIKKNGELRGCIGQIVPSKDPLWQVVRDMGGAACSEDHRFDPVSKKELPELDYEVSVLSAPEKIEDWEDIELGKHGVIVRKGARTGVFLPQVADETGWGKEEFLNQLCFQKAGLAPNCYKNDKEVELLVFTAQVFE